MYSVKKDVSQNVRGRNGVFATISPPEYNGPIQVNFFILLFIHFLLVVVMIILFNCLLLCMIGCVF